MKVKNITEMARLSVEEFKDAPKLPLYVVLDNVRSMNNIGAIFRTADTFRVKEVFLCGITAVPPHLDIRKTALGAEDSVKWTYFDSTIHAVEHLNSLGVVVCALEQTTDSVSLDEFDFMASNIYALIVGNEVKGVSQDVVDCCQYAIEIPQLGTKHSLNVSIATSLGIWECYKKMLK